MPATPGVDCPLGWQGAYGGLALNGTSSVTPFTGCDPELSLFRDGQRPRQKHLPGQMALDLSARRLG